MLTESEISAMKVADLKRELKERGLSVTGNKTELQERLQNSIYGSLEEANISEELLGDDELNDDDLEVDAKALAFLDPVADAALLSPTLPNKSLTSSIEELRSQKKVVLKRKATSDLLLEEPDQIHTDAEQDNSQNGSDSDKKVVKLSEISTVDRLALRAQKFGAPASSDAKKLARAERFGVVATSPSVAPKIGENAAKVSGKIDKNISTDINKLKERAQRFGTSVSKAMTSIENEERIKKRQERFGLVSSPKIETTTKGTIKAKPATVANQSEYADKAKKRLERFQIKT